MCEVRNLVLADSGPELFNVIATDSDQAKAQPSFHLNDDTRATSLRIHQGCGEPESGTRYPPVHVMVGYS